MLGTEVAIAEAQQRLARATTSLARWLAPLAFDTTASEVTALLTAKVINWAEQHQFACAREVPSRHTRINRRGFRWPGFIDVVATRPDGTTIVIEIDRSDKHKSISKLVAEADAGAIALWVRWYQQTAIAVPFTIGVVELRTYRRAIPGHGFQYRRTPFLNWPRPPAHSLPPVGQPVQLQFDV